MDAAGIMADNDGNGGGVCDFVWSPTLRYLPSFVPLLNM